MPSPELLINVTLSAGAMNCVLVLGNFKNLLDI